MFVLSDGELGVVGKAFDRAWDNFLRTSALTPNNLAESRALLAARILRCAYYGERDEWRLARDAVSYLRRLIPDRSNSMEHAVHRRKIALAKSRMRRAAKRSPPQGRLPDVGTVSSA